MQTEIANMEKNTTRMIFRQIKELHNWLENMLQNGFLKYFDDGKHCYKNL